MRFRQPVAVRVGEFTVQTERKESDRVLASVLVQQARRCRHGPASTQMHAPYFHAAHACGRRESPPQPPRRRRPARAAGAELSRAAGWGDGGVSLGGCARAATGP